MGRFPVPSFSVIILSPTLWLSPQIESFETQPTVMTFAILPNTSSLSNKINVPFPPPPPTYIHPNMITIASFLLPQKPFYDACCLSCMWKKE